jgi:hypothetical protein
MRVALAVFLVGVGLAGAGFAWAEVTFYERENFRGRSFTVSDPVDNFARYGFNDRASSVIVRRGRYMLCEHAGFRGRCVTLAPGRYPSLVSMGLDDRISSARPVTAFGSRPRAQLYAQPNFGGPRIMLEGRDGVHNLAGSGFDNRASSLRVEHGYWLLCSGAEFRGECQTFGPGEYPRLPRGLDNRVSSARPVLDAGDARGRRRESYEPR